MFIYLANTKCLLCAGSILNVTDTITKNKKSLTSRSLTFFWEKWTINTKTKLCNVLVVNATKKVKAGEEIIWEGGDGNIAILEKVTRENIANR